MVPSAGYHYYGRGKEGWLRPSGKGGRRVSSLAEVVLQDEMTIYMLETISVWKRKW